MTSKACYSCFFTFLPGNPFPYTKTIQGQTPCLKNCSPAFYYCFYASDVTMRPNPNSAFLRCRPCQTLAGGNDLMVERAKELGMDVDARLNKTDTPKTQTEDCIDMIDNGISTLILRPPQMPTKPTRSWTMPGKRTSRSCYMREPYSAKTSTSSSVTTHTRSDRALARTFPKKPIKVPLPY